jgi:hypothetical protein
MEFIKDRVEKIIAQERSKYQHFLDIAKKFAIDNELFVLDEDMNHFYAINAFRKSTELATLFFELDNVLGRYTKVSTKIKYYEFSITVDERELIRMTNINYNLTKVIDPVYKYDILFLGNDILNVAILEKLCSPVYVKEWSELKLNEVNFSVKGIDGKTLKSDIVETKSDVIKLIYEKFICDSDYVLIGSVAISGNISHRLQIITPNLFEDDIEKLKEVVDFKYDIIDLKFITNYRLKRMTIHVNGQSIMDIFNCAQYELVPYYKISSKQYKGKFIKVGTKYVLMRFRLIDFWSIKVLLYDKKIDLSYAKNLISVIKNEYSRIPDNPTDIIEYIGKVENLELSIKRMSNEIIHAYYPLIASRGKKFHSDAEIGLKSNEVKALFNEDDY